MGPDGAERYTLQSVGGMAVPISQSYWDQLQLLLSKRCMAKKHVNAAKRPIIVMRLHKVSEAIFAIAVLVIMKI